MLILLKVLVSVFVFAASKSAYSAKLVSSDRAHVLMSSRCELVCCSDGSSPPWQLEKDSEKQEQSFAATSVAENLRKFGIPVEQSLSWHLSKNFNEDPLIYQNLKNGARLLSALVSSSAEALIQALLLRHYLSVSNLILMSRVLVPRIDAAVASVLIADGIERVFEHPSLTPQVLDALLHVCVFMNRQAMLPEVLRLLKSCCSDLMQGRTARIKSFEVLLQILKSISHGFGHSTLSAFDMLSRFVAPLSSKTRSDGGSIINQIIMPRCLMNSQYGATILFYLRYFMQVGCRALISR